MTDQPRKDRRAQSSPENGKRGGRPRLAADTRILTLTVPADLYAWCRDRGPDEVRQALERWRIETLIV